MQSVALRQTLHGSDFFPLGLHGKHQAGTHRFAVHDHGAGPADTVLAADMGTRLPAVLADRISESAPRFDFDRIAAAVNIKCDRGFLAHGAFSALRMAARMRCRAAGISSISTPNGDSASLTALMTAAGAPMVPPSPSPLALVIEFVLGVSM